MLSTPATRQFWALVDGGPIQKAWVRMGVTWNLSHKWFCGRKATKPVQQEAAESDDLAGFRQFRFVSAVVSATREHL